MWTKVGLNHPQGFCCQYYIGWSHQPSNMAVVTPVSTKGKAHIQRLRTNKHWSLFFMPPRRRGGGGLWHINLPLSVRPDIDTVFQLGIENGGVRLWKKGTSAHQKLLKKGNIVIFSYLILKMSFSTTFSALCIKFNASTWLIVYIYVQKCS